MCSEGASSVLAIVAYRLATDSDFAHELQQEGGVETLAQQFPALSDAERGALNTLLQQTPSLQALRSAARSSPAGGDWWTV